MVSRIDCNYTITTLDPWQNCETAIHIASTWQEIAKQRFFRFDVQKDLILTDQAKDDFKKIKESFEIVRAIFVSLKAPPKLGYDFVEILYDEENTPQALSILSRNTDHLYIEYLATSPYNLYLSTPLPDALKEKVYKGGGTRLVASACQHAKKNHLPALMTRSLKSANGFYEKIGLTPEKIPGKMILFHLNMEKDPLPEALSRFIR